MRFRLLSLDQLTTDDIARWGALNEKSIEPSPYGDPRWMLTAARADDTGDQLRIAYLDDGSDPLIILPVALTRERILGRLPFTVRAAVTDDAFFRRWGVRWYPIVSPDADESAMRALLHGFRAAGISMVRIAEMFADSPAREALSAAAHARRMPWVSEAALMAPWAPARSRAVSELPRDTALAPKFALPHWNGSSNKRLGRYARALERELGEPLILTIESSADEEFMMLQAAGWKGDVQAGGNAILSTGMAGWFREVAQEFGDAGAWTMFRLGTPTTTVHMYSCVALSNGVFGLHDAYEECFARAHPGTLGRVAVQNAVVESGRFFDPCLSAEYEEAGRQFATSRELDSVKMATGRSAALLVRMTRGVRLPVWR